MKPVLDRFSAIRANLQRGFSRQPGASHTQTASGNGEGQDLMLPWSLVIGLIAVYLPAVFLLYPWIGDSSLALASLPVLLAAWLFGRRVALCMSVLLTLLTVILLIIFYPAPNLLVQVGKALMGILLLLVIGWFAGWTSETQARLHDELLKRRQVERELVEANVALRESEQRYRMLFNEANEAIIIDDLEGHFLNANETATELIGYTLEELLARPVSDIDRTGNCGPGSHANQMLREKGHILYESEFTRRDGSTFPVEINARRIEYNNLMAALSVARDITRRKQIEQSEREQRAMLDALRDIAANLTSTLQLEEVLDGILTHLERVVEYDAVTIMLVEGPMARVMRQRGYAERGFILKEERNRFPIEELKSLQWVYQNQQPLVIRDTRTDPRWIAYDATRWVGSYAVAPITIKGETIGFLNLDSARHGFFTDQHGERLQAFADQVAVAIYNARLYATVQHQAMVDTLTGLYNRRGLADLGQREMDRSARYERPIAALMFDIDNFKQFNDLYSYAVGDEVLSILAARVKNAVRKEDLVFRYGGDEFLILLADNTLPRALRVAEHVRRSIGDQPFRMARGSFHVTISLGVAAQQPGDFSLEHLVEAAGHQLHIAKQSGRNQVAGDSTI